MNYKWKLKLQVGANKLHGRTNKPKIGANTLQVGANKSQEVANKIQGGSILAVFAVRTALLPIS